MSNWGADDFVDSVGISGAIVLSISFIPQTMKIYKNIDHANMCFCILMIICSTMMAVYSIYYNVIPMFIANISVLCNNIFVFIIVRYKQVKLIVDSENDIKTERLT